MFYLDAQVMAIQLTMANMQAEQLLYKLSLSLVMVNPAKFPKL